MLNCDLLLYWASTAFLCFRQLNIFLIALYADHSEVVYLLVLMFRWLWYLILYFLVLLHVVLSILLLVALGWGLQVPRISCSQPLYLFPLAEVFKHLFCSYVTEIIVSFYRYYTIDWHAFDPSQIANQLPSPSLFFVFAARLLVWFDSGMS
jgi:hypothetical protein